MDWSRVFRSLFSVVGGLVFVFFHGEKMETWNENLGTVLEIEILGSPLSPSSESRRFEYCLN